MITVLNNSFPTKMVCECETLSYKGTPIHQLPVYPQVMVCPKFCYIKFNVDGVALWLCSECLKHFTSMGQEIKKTKSKFGRMVI